ncbi:MAG: secondary thiamine-phosphate synthase enzyme YjbQ [Dehalococcoidales bacterium]|nr:secondary thiamine-phosphate synthase enzyme YjbQ [Dehalococcoidales bacterium]
MFYKLDINTHAREEFLDITRQVHEVVSRSGVKSGLCHIFVPHTTAGILINEHADPSVVDDIAAKLTDLVPLRGSYQHLEGNSPAHIKAGLIGSSVTVFVEDGLLTLGTWQGIFFGEFDGPRRRQVWLKVVATP